MRHIRLGNKYSIFNNIINDMSRSIIQMFHSIYVFYLYTLFEHVFDKNSDGHCKQ